MGLHTKILQRRAGTIPNTQGTTYRDPHRGSPGQLLQARFGTDLPGQLVEQLMLPDIGATGTGVGIDADDGADVMVLEAGGKRSRLLTMKVRIRM